MSDELARAEEELVDALTDTFAAFLRFQRLRMAHRAVKEILGEGEEMRREDKEAKR